MRLRAQDIDDNDGGVGRVRQAHGISKNDGGVSRGRGIYNASEVSEKMMEAAEARRRPQVIYDDDGVVGRVR